MSDYTIYHNPRCSKSRQTLQLLEEHGIQPKIIEYLKNPPSQKELDNILTCLNKSPEDLMRKTEDDYKNADLANNHVTRAELIQFMVNHPKVIERPIVVKENRAIVGRPPEKVLELLS